MLGMIRNDQYLHRVLVNNLKVKTFRLCISYTRRIVYRHAHDALIKPDDHVTVPIINSANSTLVHKTRDPIRIS